MDPQTMIPLNPRDYLLLFALTSQELHGYGIVKEIERQSGGRVRVDPANLYRSLKRMMARGMVEETDPPASDEPAGSRGRYYRLTSLGRDVVRLEAARLAELTAAARRRNLLPEEKAAG